MQDTNDKTKCLHNKIANNMFDDKCEDCGKILDRTDMPELALEVSAPLETGGWEEEFESIMPLEFWATTNYPGKAEDGELQFKMWQDRETKIALLRRDVVISFLKRTITHTTEQTTRKYQKELDAYAIFAADILDGDKPEKAWDALNIKLKALSEHPVEKKI